MDAIVSAYPWPRRMTSAPGVCRRCERRGVVFGATRFGGGNYRRPGRVYRSSLCAPCALDLAMWIHVHRHSVDRWTASDIVRIVRSLYLPTTPEEAARA